MNVGLPERVYAVGDIHGHLDKLKAVHELIVADQASHGRAPIVHIGDYGDRGPDTKGVIQYLIDGLAQGEDWVCLKGNHDRMMVMVSAGRTGPRSSAESGIPVAASQAWRLGDVAQLWR